MTIELPVWWDLAAAIAVTVTVWAWAFFWPTEGMTSVADLGPMFTGLFRLIVGLFVTGVVWIAYFVVN